MDEGGQVYVLMKANGTPIGYFKRAESAELARKKCIESRLRGRVLRQILTPNAQEAKLPLRGWVSLEYVIPEDLFRLDSALVVIGGVGLTAKRASYVITVARDGRLALQAVGKQLSADEKRVARSLLEETVEDVEFPASTMAAPAFCEFRTPVLMMGRHEGTPFLTLGTDPEGEDAAPPFDPTGEGDEDEEDEAGDRDYIEGEDPSGSESDGGDTPDEETEEDYEDGTGPRAVSVQEEAEEEEEETTTQRSAALRRREAAGGTAHETRWSVIAYHLSRAALTGSSRETRIAIDKLLACDEFTTMNDLVYTIEKQPLHD